MDRYGIQVEDIAVERIDLPPEHQKALELLQQAFVNGVRTITEARTEAVTIQELERARAVAIEEKARILGPQMAGLVELFKSVQFTNVVPYPGSVYGMPFPGAIVNAINVQAEKATASTSSDRPSSPPPPESQPPDKKS